MKSYELKFFTCPPSPTHNRAGKLDGDFLLQIVAVPFKRFTKVENLKGECSPDVLNPSVGKTQRSKNGETNMLLAVEGVRFVVTAYLDVGSGGVEKFRDMFAEKVRWRGYSFPPLSVVAKETTYKGLMEVSMEISVYRTGSTAFKAQLCRVLMDIKEPLGSPFNIKIETWEVQISNI